MDELEIKQQYMWLRDEIVRRHFCNLNEEQLNAVLSNSKAVLTAACPGAGKTQVIVNRIIYLTLFGEIYNTEIVPENIREEHLMELNEYLNAKQKQIPHSLCENSVPCEKIAVITFTSMAALNMEERYKKISGSKEAPFFGTLHSLFYRIIGNFYPSLSIMGESQGFEIIKSVLSKYVDSIRAEQIRGIINEISKYKNALQFNIEHETSTDSRIFLECLNAYENYKSINGFMDFDDIIINCIKLFKENKSILIKYREKYRHILVDEFQDCDSSQIYMLQLLSEGRSIFAVGDEDQCIYGFRGSRPDCMVDYEKYFNNGVKYFLNKNYRSGTSIIEISRKVISNNKLRNSKEMLGVKRNSGRVTVLGSNSEMHQAEIIAGIILKMNHCERFETAVLYRTNNEAQKLISTLLKYKIQFILTDKSYNFFNMEVCRDIAAYFRLSTNPCCRESFIRILNKPIRYISKTKIGKINSSSFSRNWFSFLMELPDMKPDQLKVMHKFEKKVRKIKLMPPEKALEYILKSIGYRQCVKEYQVDILNELMEICSSFNTITGFLNYIDDYQREISNEAPGVVLSTIHGVKGLEYRNVFIINCNSDNMPHSNSISNIEEERRLFYVGITRAIENLWICYTKEFKGNICEKSLFIKESLG